MTSDGSNGAAVSNAAVPNEASRAAAMQRDLDRLQRAVQDRAAALVQAREASRQSRLTAEALRRDLERAEKERDAALAKVDRVVGNPVVRVGLLALRAARHVRRVATTSRPRVSGASPLAERRLKGRLLAQLPTPPANVGPRVAIVILNRNGLGHLRKLMPALETVAYRNVEIVVVDNASTDRSVAFVRGHRSQFPIRIIENAENLSFSEANNSVPRETGADLILFLNNDVRPLEPHWLGWMVETVMEPGTVACGARLIQPRRLRFGSNQAAVQPDLELQHAGIWFEWLDGMPRPRNVGGRDPLADGLGTVRERPAATAACLLVRRTAFLDVDGFDPAYVYGHEDVDLCFRLRARGGRVVVDGRASLWHDESATRRKNAWETMLRQRANRDTFYARWGCEYFREVLLDRIDGGGFYSEQRPRCAILVSADAARDRDVGPDAIATALSADGWPTTVVLSESESWPTAADIAVAMDHRVDIRQVPRHVIKVGWIGGSADGWIASPWIDDFDVLVAETDEAVEAIRAGTSHVARRFTDDRAASTTISAAIRTEVRAWVATRRVGILIQADDWEGARTSGDYHFARALQRQFERRGLPTRVYFRPDWKMPVSTRDDVLIHLWGRYPVGRRPGQTSILWILYHPELVTDDLLDAYDLVLVASDEFARTVAQRTTRPVVALHQATDPERFRPGLEGPDHDLLFVGNSRGVRRPILDDVTPTRHDLAVYGRGWPPDLLDPVYLRGDSVPNEKLPGFYNSAAIVLNDHWQEGREAGFLNNRLYDVLASGGFVISDMIDGLREEFDDGVVSYRDAADLVQLVEHYLSDQSARAARVERGRRAVLERHTFSQRVDEILRLIDRTEPSHLDGKSTAPPTEVISLAGDRGPS